MAIALFSTINQDTSVFVIILQACAFGFLSSLQYTSMNTLVYSDVTNADTSMASTILSTAQQMALSFGVATASLTAALFIPKATGTSAAAMVHGTHEAFIVLGVLTTLSSVVFFMLKPSDGANVSLHANS